MTHRLPLAAGLALATTGSLAAQTRDTTTTVRVNAFIDAYYAYDLGRPTDGERSFTTQAVRHDEVNVNLAWLGVTVERQRVRGRLALQAGTSVQANYAGEPRTGSTSGPDLARLLQEAVVGVRLRPQLWVDGGIYLSYIGLEGWTSADNPTYTRSLVADYSPYYLSGARLTWAATPRLSAQLHVMNGWQTIAENNRQKAVGLRLDYTVSPALVLTYANFVGRETATSGGGARRVFNQIMAKGTLPWGALAQGQLDVGRQGDDDWYGLVGVLQQPVTSAVSLVGRVERYADPSGVIVSTGSPRGFVVNGASAGVDVAVDRGVRWRTEWRVLDATAPIFPDRRQPAAARRNHLLTTSLSLAY